MAFEDHRKSFDTWLDSHMRKGADDVPGRVVVVMALLERLQENPSLSEDDHIAKSGMQLEKHNNYVSSALARFGIVSPLQEFGRRSSNLHGWMGPLFDWLISSGFKSFSPSEKISFLQSIESVAAERLRIINQGKPLIARYNKGTARAVIVDILDQAQEKKRAKDVAEYLVGAKLQIRLGNDVVIPKNVNTPNLNQPSDFPVGGAAIEVTVNPADSRHLSQIKRILNDTTLDVWLLVRLRDRERWQNVVDATFGEQISNRIAITDIETFVGQNISEIGRFDKDKVNAALADLFAHYNEYWLPEAGSTGLRIVTFEPES